MKSVPSGAFFLFPGDQSHKVVDHAGDEKVGRVKVSDRSQLNKVATDHRLVRYKLLQALERLEPG